MTAVASNTCYDKATNCAEADCKFIQHKDMCMKSCGQCVEGKVQLVFYSKMWLSYIFHPDDIRRNIVTWSCHLALLEQSFYEHSQDFVSDHQCKIGLSWYRLSIFIHIKWILIGTVLLEVFRVFWLCESIVVLLKLYWLLEVSIFQNMKSFNFLKCCLGDFQHF